MSTFVPLRKGASLPRINCRRRGFTSYATIRGSTNGDRTIAAFARGRMQGGPSRVSRTDPEGVTRRLREGITRQTLHLRGPAFYRIRCTNHLCVRHTPHTATIPSPLRHSRPVKLVLDRATPKHSRCLESLPCIHTRHSNKTGVPGDRNSTTAAQPPHHPDYRSPRSRPPSPRLYQRSTESPALSQTTREPSPSQPQPDVPDP